MSAPNTPSVNAEIRLSETRVRRALDGLLQGVEIFDRDLRFVYVNPAAAAQGWKTVDEVIGHLFTEVFPGGEASDFYRMLQAALVPGPPRNYNLTFPFVDGKVGYYELIVEPIEEGVFVHSLETTAQVDAQAALAFSEVRHQSMLRGIPDIVFLLERDGTVVDVHAPESMPMLQAPSALIGQNLIETLPGSLAGDTRAALARVSDSRIAERLEYDLSFPDGPRRFEASIVSNEDTRITVVSRDITARYNLEAQLRQAQKMEAIGQLTGGIAHDFNNVLTVISANADMVSTELPDDSPIRREIAEILLATRRGAEMIAQLLQFSRRGVLRRQTVDPSAVITRVSGMLRRLLPESITLDLDGVEVGATVSIDTGALEQIITNLCTNARDAMPKGGTIRIECRTQPLDAALHATHPWVTAGEHYRISVRDQGMGMDEDTRRRLFEPFFTTKPLGVGTGLGMAMVYGLMKAHQGLVQVESEIGKGTEVTLYFPVATEPQSAVSISRLRRDSREVAGGAEGILLVEDDDSIRHATRRALELRGYHVFEAADGLAGLKAFAAHQKEIALIVSDLVMPNMGGKEMADTLQREGSHVPFLFTSGYSSESVFGEAGLAPDVRFLNKPWTLTDLLSAVRSAIDSAG